MTPRPKKRENRPITNDELVEALREIASPITEASKLIEDNCSKALTAMLNFHLAEAMRKLAFLKLSIDTPPYAQDGLADALERYAAESNLDFRGHADIEGGEHA